MGNACSGQNNDQHTFITPTGDTGRIVRIAGFGWKPDLPDFRDHVVVVDPEHKRGLGRMVDNRPKDNFPIYNQGNLGSCTAQAICAAFHYVQVKQNNVSFYPSRLFVYYNERALENTISEDAGAYLRTGMKVLEKFGVCHEDLWRYDESMFSQQPHHKCYVDALNNKSREYARVPKNLNDMKSILSQGFVFVFGFTVYSSFMEGGTGSTGRVTMPPAYPGDYIVGGHAVLCVGYIDYEKADASEGDEGVFIVRNSWGPTWGDNGYFYMPYKYMTSGLCRDFWVLNSVYGQQQRLKTMHVAMS